MDTRGTASIWDWRWVVGIVDELESIWDWRWVVGVVDELEGHCEYLGLEVGGWVGG